MFDDGWIQDARREAAWDATLARRPRCADCGEPIADERCLCLGGGEYLCPGCIRYRLVETVLLEG